MHNDNIITNKVEQTKGLPNSSQTRTTKCQTKKKLINIILTTVSLTKGEAMATKIAEGHPTTAKKKTKKKEGHPSIFHIIFFDDIMVFHKLAIYL